MSFYIVFTQYIPPNSKLKNVRPYVTKHIYKKNFSLKFNLTFFLKVLKK